MRDKGNWAVDNLDIQAPWILILDADEVMTSQLRKAIGQIAAVPVGSVLAAVFHINRYFLFLGGIIHHCGCYPSWNVPFFKPRQVRCEERDMHEHMMANGPVGFIKGGVTGWRICLFISAYELQIEQILVELRLLREG